MLDQPPEKPKAKPHHAGHRERLCEHARSARLLHLPDYELLELFLVGREGVASFKPLGLM